MRFLRFITPVVVAVGMLSSLLFACSYATAKSVGDLVPPVQRVDGITAGEAMGEVWYRGYTLPKDQNQLWGNGQPCLRLGHTGSVLVGLEFQPGPCTIDRHMTVLIWGITATCDSFAPPDSGSYGADEDAQRRCAVTYLTAAVKSVVFTVDGRDPVDLRASRFAVFSPHRQVVVRDDNPFGYRPGRGSFTAWGWMAWLKELPSGQHTIRSVTTLMDGTVAEVITLVINVRA